jgi:hypothetical protein
MKFQLLFAVTAAAIAVAVPTEPLKKRAFDLGWTALTPCQRLGPALCEEAIKVSQLANEDASALENATDVKAIAKRTPGQMNTGKTYNIAGWTFIIGDFIVEQYQGTTWRFPSSDSDINWIVNNVASTIGKIYSDGDITSYITGGWQLFVASRDGNNVAGIPTAMVKALFGDAIRSAGDWISVENSLSFQIVNDAGSLLYSFSLWPANANVHLAPWNAQHL